MNLSDAWAKMYADHAFQGVAVTAPTNYFVEAHTGDPGSDGTANLSGWGREQMTGTPEWVPAPTSPNYENANEVRWTQPGAATITHYSIHSLVTGGTCYFVDATEAPVPVAAGQDFVFPAGDLDGRFREWGT